jgi:glycosyltransferase involved in cell wall biosynthesis
LLVEPDDAESLAGGLLKIFRDRTLAEQLGKNGARRVREQYSAAHMAARALEAYESVI